MKPTLHRRAFLHLAAAAWAITSPGRANAAPTSLAEVNVKAYGATGDGTTDNTAAIHAARDAIGVGGKIVFPPGAYLVSGLTASVAGQAWELSDGAVIKINVGSKSVLSVTAAGVSVFGGVFDCSNVTEHNGRAHGILINSDNVTIRNAKIVNSPFYGIAAYNHDQVVISGCIVTNSYVEGIWIQNTLPGPSDLYDITVANNVIDNSSGGRLSSGIGVHGDSHNQRINRVRVNGNTIVLPYGSQTSENTGCIGPLNCTDFTVSDNACNGGYISISCPNALRGNISNNTLRRFSYVGVELPVDPRSEVNDVIIAGNVLDPGGVPASAGIQTSASPASATGGISNLSIVGNTIRNFTVSCNLINFNSGSVCNRISVMRNLLTTAVSSGQFNGIIFTGNITGFAMSQNTVDGSSSPNSRGVQFCKSALNVSITANQFANLSIAAVDMAPSTSRNTLDYIIVAGNTVVNSGTTLKNSAVNGAVVGANIFSTLNSEA